MTKTISSVAMSGWVSRDPSHADSVENRLNRDSAFVRDANIAKDPALTAVLLQIV
jgi:hypothetical protein